MRNGAGFGRAEGEEVEIIHKTVGGVYYSANYDDKHGLYYGDDAARHHHFGAHEGDVGQALALETLGRVRRADVGHTGGNAGIASVLDPHNGADAHDQLRTRRPQLADVATAASAAKDLKRLETFLDRVKMAQLFAVLKSNGVTSRHALLELREESASWLEINPIVLKRLIKLAQEAEMAERREMHGDTR